MNIKGDIRGTAFLLTNGAFKEVDGKTSHGLIRGSTRFTITAVIDHIHSGQDAGVLLDGINRGIPMYSSIDKAIKNVGKPDYCIIGMATVGGKLPHSFEKVIKEALVNSISVINGLHDFLNEKHEYINLAESNNAQLIDIRKPRPFRELKFWTSEIYSVKCPIIALLGMDCAVGKRTTGQIILEALSKAGKKAEMIFTGQTGWLQGYKYGFIFDATLNDFVSGELSNAILNAYKNEDPEYILLEGQSALRNPSGPCGAELLLSGNAKYSILVHEINRKYYDENPDWGSIPSVESEIKLIESYNSKVIALVLNTRGCSREEVETVKMAFEKKLAIPVLLPIEEGVDKILPIMENLKQNEN